MAPRGLALILAPYSAPGGGFEYPLMLFILYVAIVLRAGERCAPA
jgi:hypothetical protein